LKNIPDTWAKKAKSEGYRSRASFKLLEIDKKYDLIRKSNLILELGSSPGGWSQVISKKKNKNCKCMAIDILNMEKVKGVNFYKLDLYSDEFYKKIKSYKNSLDLILSDMSVNLSGIKVVDEEGNKDLNLFCLELSKKMLKPTGALLIKSFNNSNLKFLKNEFKRAFSYVYIEKPLASKTSSQEVYLLGLVLK
jgi:23S rRNA (uridine2552-2'-O)-methyltransferase|tara:strand:- start:4764 stop:5342 length:579 start_codon:yes stop_codon:yes gene_type:complete